MGGKNPGYNFSGNTDNLLISESSGQIRGRWVAIFLSESKRCSLSFIKMYGGPELG